MKGIIYNIGIRGSAQDGDIMRCSLWSPDVNLQKPCFEVGVVSEREPLSRSNLPKRPGDFPRELRSLRSAAVSCVLVRPAPG